MSRDYQAEDASRTKGRHSLRLTEGEEADLAALKDALGATTLAGAILAAVDATRALVAGESAVVALAAARERAAEPPPVRGWRKGKTRKS